MHNIIGLAAFAFGALFMLIGGASVELLPTTQMDMMTPNDWLNATTQVAMPMFVGAILTLVAVITIK